MTKCEDMPYNVLTMRLLEALDAKKECIKVSKHNNYCFSIYEEGVIFHIEKRKITLASDRPKTNFIEKNYSITIEYNSKREYYKVNYIDGELMLEAIIQWYKNKIDTIKENNKKQLLVDTISCVENYKD